MSRSCSGTFCVTTERLLAIPFPEHQRIVSFLQQQESSPPFSAGTGITTAAVRLQAMFLARLFHKDLLRKLLNFTTGTPKKHTNIPKFRCGTGEETHKTRKFHVFTEEGFTV